MNEQDRPAPKRWMDRVDDFFIPAEGRRRPLLPVAVVAGVVLAQAAVIGSLLLRSPETQSANDGPASPALSTEIVTLNVAFRPDATDRAIRQTLVNADAQIVSGPNKNGVYTVSVAAEKADMKMAQLRRADQVVDSVQR